MSRLTFSVFRSRRSRSNLRLPSASRAPKKMNMAPTPRACLAATAAALESANSKFIVGYGVKGVGPDVIVGCGDGFFDTDGMAVADGMCVGAMLGTFVGGGVSDVGDGVGLRVGKSAM